MFENKRIGVFMRVYRNEPTMHKAIQSVLRQTYTNFKYYILVSEATKEVVKRYAEMDSRIIVYDGKPQDGFVTYAKSIANDENDYVTTIDADDWYEDTYLETLLCFAETNEVDAVACCHYFVDANGDVVGKREQKDIVWSREESNQFIAETYGFFRTIWGKLIRAEVISKYNEERLLTEEKYGGYGGDTMFVFNVLYEAQKVGVCSKFLYYYRISEAGNSYRLKEGRLESDVILFYYVVDFLKSVSALTEHELRFLFHVYANALLDTTRLLLNSKMSERERAEKLLYIYSHSLTEELFLREKRSGLYIPEIPIECGYGEKCYQLIFEDVKKCGLTEMTKSCYFKIFNIIFESPKDLLNIEEFSLMLKDRNCMNLCKEKKYDQLFYSLLGVLPNIKHSEAKCCLRLLKRCASNELVKMLLVNKNFVLTYYDLIILVNKCEWNEVIQWLHTAFLEKIDGEQAEVLVELWINVAALIDDASEYIFGNQVRIEILLDCQKIQDALEVYRELEELGVVGENMDLLKKSLESYHAESDSVGR